MDSKPSNSRLQHQQQEQSSEQQITDQKHGRREFASVEDLLRHDATQVTPPPAIAERLRVSLETEQQPDTRESWWRRLFGRRSL
jgi:hypothetical protein